MKRLNFILAFCILIVSCKSPEQRPGYLINGTATDIYNGIRVFLNSIDARGQLVPIDTAIVMNETFKFEGELKHPKMVYLTVNSVQGRFPFMLENTTLEMVIDKVNLNNTSVKGSDIHDLYMTYINGYKKMQSDIRLQNGRYRKALMDKDSTAMLLEMEKLQADQQKLKEYAYNFMEEHPGSFLSLELFEAQIKQRGRDDQRLLSVYQSLEPTLKNSIKGIRLTKEVEAIKLSVAANKKLQIGAIAPEFSGPNPKGEVVNLKDVVSNGKVTIIDFWAAWCGPCRRENPNVVRIYNKYHNEGLNIIGVSLDGQSRQKDPKAAWMKAIEDDQLTWNHVSNLNYFNDPIAQLYNIKAIPATFILDKNGAIVAKNLRGQALELKVKELLENN